MDQAASEKIDEIIVIATSAPPDRQGYRRDLLSNISYPVGTPGRFVYRRRWIEVDQSITLASYQNRRAIIVFCSQEENTPDTFRFVPLRFAQIEQLEFDSAAEPNDDTYITVKFRLGEFVAFASQTEWDKWQGWVLSQANKYPRPKGKDVPSTRFVFVGKDFTSLEPTSGDAAWPAITQDIGIKNIVGKSELFRITNIYKGRSDEKPITFTRYGERFAFEMEAGQLYRIKLQLPPDFQQQHAESLAANVSSKSISPARPLLESTGASTYAEIIVNTARVYLPEIATLVIEDPKNKAELITGPNPEIIVILKPPWWVPWIVGLLVAGAFLTNMTPDVLKEAWAYWNKDRNLELYPALLAYLVKAIGSVAIGAVAFLGFRKTP